jgi:hypothetical protein
LSPYRPDDYVDANGRLTPSTHLRSRSVSSNGDGVEPRHRSYSQPQNPQQNAFELGTSEQTPPNNNQQPLLQYPILTVPNTNGQAQGYPQPLTPDHSGQSSDYPHQMPSSQGVPVNDYPHQIPSGQGFYANEYPNQIPPGQAVHANDYPSGHVEHRNSDHPPAANGPPNLGGSMRPPVARKPHSLQAQVLPERNAHHQPSQNQQKPPTPTIGIEETVAEDFQGAFEPPLSKETGSPQQRFEAVTQEWDFTLPGLTNVATLIPNVEEGVGVFSVSDVVAALQHGANTQIVQKWLQHFDQEVVRQTINDDVAGFPAMFYVVATNDEQILRTWINYGGNPKVVHHVSRVPLLAFAVANGMNIHANTTLIVATLLSAGASPEVIPSAFYDPCLKDLPDGGPNEAALTDLADDNKRWCGPATRKRLSKALNLSQRYYLHKASRMKEPSKRQVDLARRRKAQGLLGLPYFLIGQSLAANFLVQNLLLHIAEPRKRPLVLTFAGPSGHGKTEMARRLGALLSLPLQIVDCTIYNQEMELFGPRHPYVGADKGSPLNNFLTTNDGQRCIVFLDEFEKTTSDIHKALLIPFDNGK